ncbi:MAG: transcription termination/antitermination NusG family protein, partial [Brevibacterium aurantiacum]
MSDTSSPEQETPETQNATPEESSVAPVVEDVDNETSAVSADDAQVEDASAEEAPVAEAASTEDAVDEVVADDAETDSESDSDEESESDEDGAAADEVDPAEEFKSELRMQEGDWYVIHSYAGYENRVKQNLENRAISLNLEEFIFESQVPMEDVVEIKNGQRKQVRRVRIPGYVLVRMELTDESWGAVRHTPGVTGFVGNAYDPTPL